MKKIWDKAWQFIFKHYSAIVVALILTCAYFCMSIVKDANYRKAEFTLIKENLNLQQQLVQQSLLVKEQDMYLTEAMDLAQEQGMALRNHEDMMTELVGKLKRLSML